MNKKLLTALAVGVVASMTVFGLQYFLAPASNPQNTSIGLSSATTEEISVRSGNFSSVHGTYTDSSASLSELIERADLVLRAEVANQVQVSPMAIGSTLRVTRVIKGKAPAEPLVYQLGALSDPIPNEELLRPGQEYFLFLGKQSDSYPNTFYITGAMEGKFEKQDGKLRGEERFTKDLHLTDGVDPFNVLEEIVKKRSK